MLTSILVIGTIFFLYAKAITLITRSDVDIFTANREDALDYNFKFSAKNDGFFVAAALTEYNSNTTVTEEARYGELIIRHYGWGYSDDEIVAEGTEAELLQQRQNQLSLFPMSVFPIGGGATGKSLLSS